jgi:hypothetical protein
MNHDQRFLYFVTPSDEDSQILSFTSSVLKIEIWATQSFLVGQKWATRPYHQDAPFTATRRLGKQSQSCDRMMQLYGPIPIFPLKGIPFNPAPSAKVS